MLSLNKISLDGTLYNMGNVPVTFVDTSLENLFVLEGRTPGIYQFNSTLPNIKGTLSNTETWGNRIVDGRIYIFTQYSTSLSQDTPVFSYLADNGEYCLAGYSATSADGLTSLGSVGVYNSVVLGAGNQTINGTKTFASAPVCTETGGIRAFLGNHLITYNVAQTIVDGKLESYLGFYDTNWGHLILNEPTEISNNNTMLEGWINALFNNNKYLPLGLYDVNDNNREYLLSDIDVYDIDLTSGSPVGTVKLEFTSSNDLSVDTVHGVVRKILLTVTCTSSGVQSYTYTTESYAKGVQVVSNYPSTEQPGILYIKV